MRHSALTQAFAILIVSASLAAQQPPEIPLWRDVVPGAANGRGPERVRIADGGDHVVSNIHRPTITPYLPSKDANTRAAVIIAPGGGHRELWIDHEGYNPAQWFAERGIAAFVLKYRLAKEDSSTYTVDDHALSDMRRAMRLVRSRAAEWGIDTARIGVMGFSAGGELAALLAMRWSDAPRGGGDAIDALSAHPAFQALIYPGNSARFTATKASPPAFIVAGYGDRPDIARGMAELYLKYKDAGVPAELHVYASAGHGFGMRSTNKSASGKWPARFAEWLEDIKMVARK